ncbi:MAG: cytochrome P450 [Gammaproteobacteria bacterium]
MTSSTSLSLPKGPSLFYLLNLASLDRPSFLTELSLDYGEVARLPSLVRTYLINNPDYLQDILLKNHENYVKGGLALKPLSKALGQGILMIKGKTWQNRRRLFAPHFQPSQTESFTKIIVEATEKTIRTWRTNQTFDICHEMMKIVLSIALKTFFSTELSAEKMGRMIKKIGCENKYACSTLALLPWLPSIGNLRLQFAKRYLQKEIRSIIHDHQKNLHTYDDLLSHIIKQTDTLNLTPQDIFDEAKTFLLTGHETTGTALGWTWYLLGNHPDIYQKVLDETDAKLNGHSLEKNQWQDLTYTKMVFEETLRLFPPIWITGRKVTETMTLGSYQISAGSDILICPYTLHRQPQYWENPERFIPERFESEQHKNRHRFSYLPFGAGPRICIASHFAMQMALTIIATICQHCKIETIHEQNIQYDHLISLKPQNGILVKIKRFY